MCVCVLSLSILHRLSRRLPYTSLQQWLNKRPAWGTERKTWHCLILSLIIEELSSHRLPFSTLSLARDGNQTLAGRISSHLEARELHGFVRSLARFGLKAEIRELYPPFNRPSGWPGLATWDLEEHPGLQHRAASLVDESRCEDRTGVRHNLWEQWPLPAIVCCLVSTFVNLFVYWPFRSTRTWTALFEEFFFSLSLSPSHIHTWTRV